MIVLIIIIENIRFLALIWTVALLSWDIYNIAIGIMRCDANLLTNECGLSIYTYRVRMTYYLTQNAILIFSTPDLVRLIGLHYGQNKSHLCRCVDVCLYITIHINICIKADISSCIHRTSLSCIFVRRIAVCVRTWWYSDVQEKNWLEREKGLYSSVQSTKSASSLSLSPIFSPCFILIAHIFYWDSIFIYLFMFFCCFDTMCELARWPRQSCIWLKYTEAVFCIFSEVTSALRINDTCEFYISVLYIYIYSNAKSNA